LEQDPRGPAARTTATATDWLAAHK